MPMQRRKFAKKPVFARNPRATKPWARRPKTAMSGFKAINSYGVPEAPFPAKLQTNLVFGQSKKLLQTLAGVAVANTYRINSIYDPDLSGAGRTVVGYSPLNDMYGSYLVTKCKIWIRFFQASFAAIRVGVRLRMNVQNTAVGNSTQDILEKPMTWYKILNVNDKSEEHFNLEVYPWQVLGLSKQEYLDNPERFGASINTSPSVQGYMDVFLIFDDADAAATTYDIKMTFETQLYNRIGQTSSLLV